MKIGCPHQNVPIIPEKMIFSILRNKPRSTKETYYFSIEDDPEFEYKPICSDFGPPPLNKLHRFVKFVKNLIEERKENVLHFYCSTSGNIKSNMVVYASFLRMVHLGITSIEAYRPFEPITAKLFPFRDASNGKSLLDLYVIDVLNGIQKAIDNNWYNYESFDVDKWEKLQLVENGNMNWIIPDKLMAMASPNSLEQIPKTEIKLATPKILIPAFQELKINHVVRLNKHFYDAAEFVNAGINFTDLYFEDGTTPSNMIIDEFFKVMDEEGSIVALHCRTGLGRTYVFLICVLFYFILFNY